MIHPRSHCCLDTTSEHLGFPGGLDGKESACNVGDLGSIPGSGRSSGKGKGYPLPVFLPGEFHGQRSLAGYSPWGCKELDMTEQLTLHFLSFCAAPPKANTLPFPEQAHHNTRSVLNNDNH